MVFRQINAGKVTINTSVEFFRGVNKYVSSIKPLFQRTNDILEEQNDIDHSSSIPKTLHYVKRAQIWTRNVSVFRHFSRSAINSYTA